MTPDKLSISYYALGYRAFEQGKDFFEHGLEFGTDERSAWGSGWCAAFEASQIGERAKRVRAAKVEALGFSARLEDLRAA